MSIITSKNAMANYYGTQATQIGLANTAQSTTSTITGEISGGTPAYARVATTWGSASSSAITGTAVTINVPTTTTVTHALLCTASTGSTTLFDWCQVTSTTYNAQGSAIITPTFTMS